MFITHLKVAIRNLYRNRLFAFINILGLSLGLAACIYVAVLIRHETSFDRFHPDINQLYRLVSVISNSDNKQMDGRVWGPVGAEMLGEISGIENFCRVSGNRNMKARNNDQAVKLDEIRFADPSMFDILGFSLVRGSANSLNDPGTLFLTEKYAQQLFGDTDPIGITLTTSNQQVLTVSGIIENPPSSTIITFNGILSYKTAVQDPEIYIGWDGGMIFQTFMKLGSNVKPESVEAQFPAYLQHRINDKWEGAGWHYGLQLQPVKKIHLSTDYRDEAGATRSKGYLVILGTIALIILLLAVINYINLTSALANRRVREMVINKVIGANRSRIRSQVLIESVLTTLFSSILAVIWVKSFTPGLNHLTVSNFSLAHYTLFIFGVVILLTLITGLVAGAAPAGILARINLTSNRQGLGTGAGRTWVRNGLVVFQFFAAIVLLSCFFMVNRQSKYLINRDVGYHKDDIVSLFSDRGLPFEEAQRVKGELMKIPEISMVSIASEMPGQGLTSNGYRLEGDDKFNVFNVIYTDQDFLECFGLELVKGRNFYDNLANDRFSFLVNESMVSFAGWEDALNKKIERNGTHEIIGVVKDFHFASLESPIQPLIISCNPRNDSWAYFNFNIRFNTTNKQALIQKMDKVWKDNLPEVIFDYRFMTDYLKQNYVTIGQLQKIVTIFSLLAILIAIIGLFGMSAYITQSRSKEIGIRKVNGAASRQILFLLNYQMVRWVIGSLILAIPLAIILINKWLAYFANRATLSAGIFILAGGIALLLAILTVSWESLRAARQNPVKTLRWE